MLRSDIPALSAIVAALAALGATLGGCTEPAPRPASTDLPSHRDATLIGAWRIYPGPGSPPVDNALLVVRAGKIVAIDGADGEGISRPAPRGVCTGGVIVAGFHNSHVHFTESKFENAAQAPAGDLSYHVAQMLTRYGFTTVTDVGSDVRNTVVLRERIERGEVDGPRILTAGTPLYPHNGIPFYLEDMPPELLGQLPQPKTAAQAALNVIDNLGRGADATKLFVATPQRGHKVTRMDPAVIAAAVTETHNHGRLVFAHPTDNAGLRAALEAGVDVLVHTTLEEGPTRWEPQLVRDMVDRGIAVIPTLQLWGYELDKKTLPDRIVKLAISDTVEELRAFAQAGGEVLFGTDVGYMTQYDPTEEYDLMARAGLSPMQILASLTTAPAARWRETGRRGRLQPGMDADFVVLEGDPAEDVRNFARVRCTFRGGELIYSAAGP